MTEPGQANVDILRVSRYGDLLTAEGTVAGRWYLAFAQSLDDLRARVTEDADLDRWPAWGLHIPEDVLVAGSAVSGI